MNFNDSFGLVINTEAGLTLDPKDSGNWTSGATGYGELKGSKYGISAASYPTLDIANITLDDAKVIYKRDFWDKLSLDKLPSDVSFDIFDCAVNSGISRSIKLLQKTIGSTPDGVMGQITIQRANNYGTKLSLHFNANRLLFYTDLPSFDIYGKGWTIRIANNMLNN